MLIIFLIVVLLITFFILLNYINLQNKDGKESTPDILPEKQEDSEIQSLERQLLKNPKDIPALFSLINVFFEKGKYNDAYNNLEILLKQDLSQMRALKIKTLILASDTSQKLKSLEKAELYAEKAYEIDPTEVETLKRICLAKYNKGDFENAANFSRKITILDPTCFEGFYYWGMSEYHKSNTDLALQNLKNALKIKPDDFNSMITMGKAYTKKNDKENALIFYNDAIKFAKEQKEQIEVLYNRGMLFKKENKLKEAADDFKTLLKKSPEDGTKLLALKSLIEIKKEEKEISQVIWYIKDFLTIKPNHQHYLEELKYYLELDSSTMFQKFEMVNGNEFLQLCIEIASEILPIIKISEAKIKEDQSVEIIVITKDEDSNHKELVWFIRSTNPVGVIPINNLYARMRQTSSKECRIISNNFFNDEAKDFSRTRMISLVEKKGLIKYLNKIVETKELNKGKAEINT